MSDLPDDAPLEHNVTAQGVSALALDLLGRLGDVANAWGKEQPKTAGSRAEAYCAFLVTAMVVHHQAITRMAPYLEQNPDLVDWCKEIYGCFLKGMGNGGVSAGKALQLPAIPRGGWDA